MIRQRITVSTYHDHQSAFALPSQSTAKILGPGRQRYLCQVRCRRAGRPSFSKWTFRLPLGRIWLGPERRRGGIHKGRRANEREVRSTLNLGLYMCPQVEHLKKRVKNLRGDYRALYQNLYASIREGAKQAVNGTIQLM
jgi:hypothetical protein